MNILNSIDGYSKRFGAVFTPMVWAKKIVEKHFFEAWLQGATILDPTAGEGVFIEAFLLLAREKGIELSQEKLTRLFGVELNPDFVQRFFNRIETTYSIQFPQSNYRHGDILFQQDDIKADFLVGNPPWVNFADLNDAYKETIKHLFIEYGLVANSRDLLLGNARTDIATLILMKVLHGNLRESGKAVFFLPLSIFQNDGANSGFRHYKVKGVDFCVDAIMDFNGTPIFENILGRYGVAQFSRNSLQTFPIKYHVLENGKWHLHQAKPLFNSTDPLTVFDNKETEKRLTGFQKIILEKQFQPRQGVNTCGANDIFFFTHFKTIGQNKVELQSKLGEVVTVSAKYVFPLAVASTLLQKDPQPEKVILIPHQENGKPIDWEELQRDEGLCSYLLRHKSHLENRKGVLINTWIKKGFWWALLGIGEYSFAPYKVMWKAFGDNVFSPQILHPNSNLGAWQGNQSLNAFIGTSTLAKAKEIHTKLSNPLIQDYLASLRMQGTCNWAQPGRMKKMMEFV